MGRKVAVIGMGCVSALGFGVERYWRALLGGRSGIRAIERYDLDGFPARCGAEVPPSVLASLAAGPWSADVEDPTRRNARMIGGAAAEALVACGWLDDAGAIARPPGDAPAERRGLYAAVRPEEGDDTYGTEGSVAATSRDENGARLVPVFPLRLAADLDLRGSHLLLHDACTTGTALLGEAFHDMLGGRIDLAVVAAANADLTLDTLCHYTMLSALSKGGPETACRPFDVARDGFVRGEGAAAVVLRVWDDEEEPTPAGALAEVIGYGASGDAYRPTAGHPEQRGLVLSIERCLADAGLDPAAVEHVNAHGTGTPLNDEHEARALHRVFGERAASIPLTANKSVTGHASFASGLLEAIAVVRTLQTGKIPPIAGSTDPDPQLPPLDLVLGKPRRANPHSALSLSSAFGGLNAALLLRRI